jgi:hypothetical protein
MHWYFSEHRTAGSIVAGYLWIVLTAVAVAEAAVAEATERWTWIAIHEEVEKVALATTVVSYRDLIWAT